MITGESGRRPPSAPSDRRPHGGRAAFARPLACGPRERSHLRPVRPLPRRQRMPGDELAARRSGRHHGDRRGLGRLARLQAPRGPLPHRMYIPRCGAVTAPCGAPRPPSSGLRGPRAAEGLGVVRTLPRRTNRPAQWGACTLALRVATVERRVHVTPRVAGANPSWARGGGAPAAGRICRRSPPSDATRGTAAGTGQHRDDRYRLVPRPGGHRVHRRPHQPLRPCHGLLSHVRPDHLLRLHRQERGRSPA